MLLGAAVLGTVVLVLTGLLWALQRSLVFLPDAGPQQPAGAARHPAWYANVLAHPEVGLRDGGLDLTLVAREVTRAERSRWWSAACTVFPSFVEYQRRTRRRIPVLLLEPPEA